MSIEETDAIKRKTRMIEERSRYDQEVKKYIDNYLLNKKGTRPVWIPIPESIKRPTIDCIKCGELYNIVNLPSNASWYLCEKCRISICISCGDHFILENTKDTLCKKCLKKSLTQARMIQKEEALAKIISSFERKILELNNSNNKNKLYSYIYKLYTIDSDNIIAQNAIADNYLGYIIYFENKITELIDNGDSHEAIMILNNFLIQYPMEEDLKTDVTEYYNNKKKASDYPQSLSAGEHIPVVETTEVNRQKLQRKKWVDENIEQREMRKNR